MSRSGNEVTKVFMGKYPLIGFSRLGMLFLILLSGILVGFSEIQKRKTIRMVAFGDSITATRKTVDQVFAQRLPDLLDKKFTLEVINAGVGSSHTGSIQDNAVAKVSHARDRFEEAVLVHNPDLVTIGFGTNDAYIDSKTPDGASRIALDQYRNNLIYMIKELQKRKVKIILIAPNPLSDPRPEFQDQRLFQYVKVVRALAKEYRTGLADNYQLFMDYKRKHGDYASLLLDGVHPNDEGHRLIADNLAKQIRRVVKRHKFRN